MPRDYLVFKQHLFPCFSLSLYLLLTSFLIFEFYVSIYSFFFILRQCYFFSCQLICLSLCLQHFISNFSNVLIFHFSLAFIYSLVFTLIFYSFFFFPWLYSFKSCYKVYLSPPVVYVHTWVCIHESFTCVTCIAVERMDPLKIPLILFLCCHLFILSSTPSVVYGEISSCQGPVSDHSNRSLR